VLGGVLGGDVVGMLGGMADTISRWGFLMVRSNTLKIL
jgi:hypothetical protein